MVKRDVVISRVNKLNEYVHILKSVKKYGKEAFMHQGKPLVFFNEF